MTDPAGALTALLLTALLAVGVGIVVLAAAKFFREVVSCWRSDLF